MFSVISCSGALIFHKYFVVLIFGVTVALLALTEMDGRCFFQRFFSDAAPIRRLQVEMLFYFKSGFQHENALQAKQVAF